MAVKETTPDVERPTTLIDIYEAAGATVNEKRTHVTNLNQIQPFDIVLRVIPTALHIDGRGLEEMTFGVVPHSSVHFERVPEGTRAHEIQHCSEVTLPVNQVRLKEK